MHRSAPALVRLEPALSGTRPLALIGDDRLRRCCRRCRYVPSINLSSSSINLFATLPRTRPRPTLGFSLSHLITSPYRNSSSRHVFLLSRSPPSVSREQHHHHRQSTAVFVFCIFAVVPCAVLANALARLSYRLFLPRLWPFAFPWDSPQPQGFPPRVHIPRQVSGTWTLSSQSSHDTTSTAAEMRLSPPDVLQHIPVVQIR